MDAHTVIAEIAERPEDGLGSGEKLSAYGRARRRRERTRRIIRGAIGIFAPLAVWRTIFNTLTLNYDQRWLYGPNIYEHLASSFARAVSGFTIAALCAI